MRAAAIILALVAMIFGPVFGAGAGHAASAGALVSASSGVTPDCDGGHCARTQAAHDHCQGAAGICSDANGCRHGGCFAGGPIPAVAGSTPLSGTRAERHADGDSPEGRDIAPALDPPRRT